MAKRSSWFYTVAGILIVVAIGLNVYIYYQQRPHHCNWDSCTLQGMKPAEFKPAADWLKANSSPEYYNVIMEHYRHPNETPVEIDLRLSKPAN